MNLQKLLSQPEGKTLEFKRNLSSLRPILKTLVGFANTAGGTLIIGRSDDGKIIGVDDVLRDEERLASAIADSIRPAMMPEIEIYSHEGKPLLIVTVPHWRGPFYLKTEGPEKGVYVRLGSTNRRAGEELLAELQRSLGGLSYDQMPLSTMTVDDLDVDKIQQVFASVRRTIDDHKLESMGVLVSHTGRPVVSHGGLILFGRDRSREQFFPDARVSCACFRGTDRTDFIDRLDIEGSVIAIYSDRMEIQNPGMLPFGMTMEDFKDGVSKVRNRVIARVFRELGLMEEWGSGYRRVMAAC